MIKLPHLLTLLLTACATMPRANAQTPVATVGVAFDDQGEFSSFAEGLADPASGRRITPDDPARIASVSKIFVAIGVMKLVELGKLDLDSDVSGYLGWSLRNPRFPKQPITLRMLLSHTGSIRDHDDQYAIPLGGSVQSVMADPRSWDRRFGPGTRYFAYSNMNFPIVGSIVERVTGERFDRWMRREVLDPLRIDACFNWPTCSDAAVARAVVLTQNGKPIRDDLGGRRPDCPVFVRDGEPCDLARGRLGENGALFAPQGGLRISARGLARVGRMLLLGGTMDGVRILSPASVDELLKPEWRFDGRNGSRTDESESICAYGLAAQQLPSIVPGCKDTLPSDAGIWVGHAGEAYGLRSGLWIDRKRGRGVAYFITGLPDHPPRARTAFSAAEEAAFERTARLFPY